MSGTERGHAGHFDAVFHDPEQFQIASPLDAVGAQQRRLRVESLPDRTVLQARCRVADAAHTMIRSETIQGRRRLDAVSFRLTCPYRDGSVPNRRQATMDKLEVLGRRSDIVTPRPNIEGRRKNQQPHHGQGQGAACGFPMSILCHGR